LEDLSILVEQSPGMVTLLIGGCRWLLALFRLLFAKKIVWTDTLVLALLSMAAASVHVYRHFICMFVSAAAGGGSELSCEPGWGLAHATRFEVAYATRHLEGRLASLPTRH
jgi:hypothetical protein